MNNNNKTAVRITMLQRLEVIISITITSLDGKVNEQ